jgi:hypothetical protein
MCREVYDKLSPGFRGRCTAPLLIDKKAMRAVSNESSSIVRNLGQLQMPGCHGIDLYPQQLQAQIDQLNEQVCCIPGSRGQSRDFTRAFLVVHGKPMRSCVCLWGVLPVNSCMPR